MPLKVPVPEATGLLNVNACGSVPSRKIVVKSGLSLSAATVESLEQQCLLRQRFITLSVMKRQDFHALEYEGTTYDCGDKIGLLRANVAFALRRPDLVDAARQVLRALL